MQYKVHSIQFNPKANRMSEGLYCLSQFKRFPCIETMNVPLRHMRMPAYVHAVKRLFSPYIGEYDTSHVSSKDRTI